MAFDAYLELDGIPGESSDSKHSGWIDVLSFEHSAQQPNAGSVGSRGVERVNQGPFRFRHEVDKSSAKLQSTMHTGANIAKAKLEVCKATGDKQVYYTVELENISIGSVRTVGNAYQSSGSAGGDAVAAAGETQAPIEDVELWAGKVTWTYTETDHKTGKAKGNVEGHWDYEENTGG